MKLIREDQILSRAFRQKVIEEIVSTENVTRKNIALRRYEIFRDRIKKWVIESLTKEGLKAETLLLMETRAANISICKKIVKKLARAYTNGVDRDVKDAKSKEAIESLAKEMDFNSKMMKADQYVQLFKNTLVGVIPELNSRESIDGEKKYDIKVRVMPPHSYDVIEDAANPEKERVVILTDFIERNRAYQGVSLQNTDGRSIFQGIIPQFDQGNKKDEIIADNPDDAGRNQRTFIWWSEHYHFTTDEKGTVIADLSPEDGQTNPIGMMPWVTLAEDQDGNYWSIGGDDLEEGSILLNKLLTDMYSIAFHQGWGQMVISGKDIPKDIPVGPRKALILNRASNDDPPNEVFFANASPPLADWMAMIEQYTALLLSTNNLSPRTVAGKLDATDPASGIALLIDQSESTVDVKERQKLFIDYEPLIWEITRKWHEVLKNSSSLSQAFDEIQSFTDSFVKLEFSPVQQVITEKDKIDILQARKNLGLDTMIDLLKRDNPNLTDQEAEEKLLELQQEKLQRLSTAMNQIATGQIKPPQANPAGNPAIPGQQSAQPGKPGQAEIMVPPGNPSDNPMGDMMNVE